MEQIFFTKQNPEAETPLVLSAAVECNTTDERILSNVLINAKKASNWLARCPEHDRVAVICGSGPSLADCVQDIRGKGDIFALNNAANWLYKTHQIIPDYQVIMDAQPQTADLIGPARTHLFASMVDPILFDRVPTARLWHATHGNVMVDEQEGFPDPGCDYCLIGSGITVGNTTMALVYAMGYRTIHVYGMDSSHRDGKGHILHQKINDGDPCLISRINGREFVTSFTMKLQAINFIPRAKQLEESGCKIYVHGDGYLPALWESRKRLSNEKEKYREIWDQPEYSLSSPGERIAGRFIEIANPHPSMTIADLGCGTGRGGSAIKRLRGCTIKYVDFADNCIKGANGSFVQADLSQPISLRCDMGYCCDVMEHIPPDQVDAVLENICEVAPKVFFQISLIPDDMGELIGRELHLSVHDADWWRVKLSHFGRVLHFEDHGDSAIYFLQSFDYSE
jgi:SAM-dependent methyltransferase